MGKQEIIGKTTAPGWCSDPHLHVALRQVTFSGTNKVDVSKYVNKRPFAMPKWVEDCDNYILVWQVRMHKILSSTMVDAICLF